MNKVIIISLSIIIILFIIWIVGAYFVERGLEEPDYNVIKSKKFYEIREYKSYIIAETSVTGTYKESVSKGFRIIADYIFGNNVKKDKIAMTVPVTTKESLSEKISMTVPVISGKKDKSWTIAFVMPKKYTLETLPEAKTDKITFKKVAEKKVAVHTFTWFVTEEKLKAKTAQLLEELEKDGYVVESIQSARYNPPFSPPFFYRNEIWAILK